MAWSVTVNGNTYIESQFTPYGYAVNLPLLIADVAAAIAAAATSASTATTQAGIATTQAGIATTQAGNASTSASTATTQAGTATTQAGIATTQASNASTSASTATTQAGTATTQAGIATTQASNASTSASDAGTSAGAASTSASGAATSASTATTQAGNASTSASNAAASEAAAAASVAALLATSTTSNTIGTGPFSFTIQTGKQINTGEFMVGASAANGANYIHGQVSSYNSGTGALVFEGLSFGGSGAHTDWNFTISGPRGPQGAAGSLDFSIVGDVAVVYNDKFVFGDTSNSLATARTTVAGAVNAAFAQDATAGGALGTLATQSGTFSGTSSGTNTGDQTSVSGNAGTATVLATTRAIYGNNFDGSAALTAIISSVYGGTGNGFAKLTGPATTEKEFALPNASATILTSNAAVTVAQGGTGLQTLTANNVILGNGTSNVAFVAPGTSGNVLTSNGTTWASAAAGGSGGFTQLAQDVNSGAVASVVFLSLAAYDEYLVEWSGMSHDNGSATFLRLNLSTDNGANYFGDINVSGSVANTVLTNGQGRYFGGKRTWGFLVSQFYSSTAVAVGAGVINAFNFPTLPGVNAIRMNYSAGNIDAGTITIYGK